MLTIWLRTSPAGIARPPDEKGHPDDLLVADRLLLWRAVLALGISVVGGEDDVSIIEPAGLFQGFDDIADEVVDRAELAGTVAIIRGEHVDGRLIHQRRLAPGRLVADVGFVEVWRHRQGKVVVGPLMALVGGTCG